MAESGKINYPPGASDDASTNAAMRAAFEKAGIGAPEDILERAPQALGAGVPGPEDRESSAEMPFSATEARTKIDDDYFELAQELRGMDVEPNDLPKEWGAARKARGAIRRMIGDIEKETDPTKRERLAGQVHAQMERFRGALAESAGKAAQEYADRHSEEPTAPEPVDESADEKSPPPAAEVQPPDPLNEAYSALKKAEKDLADAQEANRASLEAREVAVEKLRNLDRIREDARRAMSGEPPLTDEEWEHMKRESSEEKPVDTDVHAENVSRFKSFMRGAVAQLNEIGHGVAQDVRAVGMGALHPITSAKELYRGARTNAEKAAAYAAYFTERGRSMDEKLAKLKVDSVKLIENYNALPAHRKLELTVALATASGVASGFSATLSGLLTGAMFVQRGFAGLGFARNRYTGVEKKIAQDAHWLFDENSPTWKKVIYAGALGAAYSGATATAAYGLKDFIAHELYGTTPVPEHGGAAAPHAPAPEVPKPAEVGAAEQTAGHGAAPAAGAAHETTKAAAEQATQAAPAAPQTAAQLSVEVMKDRGYEQGVWELWKHMHDPTQHFTLPPDTAPDSDLAQLYHADQHTIGGLAHRLAIKHEFFKPGAIMPNDRIVEHSHFSFSSNGEVQVEAPGHEAIVSAPEHAAATPAYHSEAVPAPEHAQLHDVRARLGITEEQQTAELNRMSLEAHQAIDHPAPAPVGPETAPSEMGPHAFANSHAITIDPDAPHGYFRADGKLYAFGGRDAVLNLSAQDHVSENQSVFVDESYSFLGIKFPRVIEYVFSKKGLPPALVIHHDLSLIPRPDDFVKRLW